ncbi:MAG: manganese efflux pump MntP family protein [Treponema sp.]|nr:manganese efflux pump MntP family protein [Treponema sp.]
MEWNFMFFVNSLLLGIGLAMDAFSVSIANALTESKMKRSRMCAMAGIYGAFQFVMPMIGWICVHTIIQVFSVFQKFIPWIALLLLSYIGGKMLYETFSKKEEEEKEFSKITHTALIIQGIATSIDALSVGFTIADYGSCMALTASFIIAIVTFFICMTGLKIGKKFGEHVSSKANILGGIILIAIGIEIFVKGLFF